jgi:hypothetical protein
MEGLKAAIARIIGSQKAIYAGAIAIVNAIAASFGYDLTEPLVLGLDALFGVLLLAQWVLDLRWGSPSDKTGAFEGGFVRFEALLGALVIAVLLVVALTGCKAKIGPGDSPWVDWSFANGLCTEFSGFGADLEFGHCGVDDLLEVEPEVEPVGPAP